MSFEIIDTPSGGVLIKGKLIQKKLAAKSKRLVMLCFPKSIEDVDMLHGHLTLTNKFTGQLREDFDEEANGKNMEIYGHLSLSAISGFPLLIIGTTARTFIHFSQIQGLYDEQDLGQACSFSLLTAQTEFRFFAQSSLSYQKWVGALTQAFENMSGNHSSNNQFRPTSPVRSDLSRPQSVMSRDPEDYVAAHRQSSMNRRSASQNRRNSFAGLFPTRSNTVMSGSEVGSDHYSTPRRRPTAWQKIKGFFNGDDADRDERGRGQDDNDTFKNRMRRRSKSVAKFLGLSKDDREN